MRAAIALLAGGVWHADSYHYDETPRELQGQTIGLIGFGAIGQMLVPYLKPFAMRILVYDPYVAVARCAALGVERTDLPTLLQAADIVSVHARVTPETIDMIGARELAQMKPGAYFINTARGSIGGLCCPIYSLDRGPSGGGCPRHLCLGTAPGRLALAKIK